MPSAQNARIESEGKEVARVSGKRPGIDLVETIKDCYQSLANQHAKRVRNTSTYRALYNLDHYSAAFGYGSRKEGEQRYVDPQPKDVVDIATALLGTAKPRIHAYAMKMTTKKQGEASDIEEFAWAVLAHNERRWGEPIFRLSIQDALMVGTGVVFCGWDSDHEGEGDEYDDLPLVMRYVNPENFYWAAGGKQAYAIQMEAYNRRVDIIEREFNVSIFKTEKVGRKTKRVPAAKDDTVLYIDYWWTEEGKVFHAIVAGDSLVLDKTPMPNYPDLPYSEIICYRTSQKKPHLRAMGMLYGLVHQIIQKEKMVNHLMQSVMGQGDPLFIAPATAAQIDRRPGSILRYDPEGKLGPESYKWLPPPGAPKDIYDVLGIFEHKSERASFGPASYGGGGPAASGVAQHVQLGADQVRLAIPQADAGLGWSRVFTQMAGLAANYAKGKKLTALIPGADRKVQMISGDRLRGWMFEVTLTAETSESLSRALVVAGNARQSGVKVSDRYLLEKLIGIEQPDRILEEQLIEDLMNDPALRQAAFVMAIEKLGGDAGAVLAKLQGEPGQGAVPPPMPTMPPTDAMPPGMMGQPLPQEMGLPQGGVQALAPELEGVLEP